MVKKERERELVSDVWGASLPFPILRLNDLQAETDMVRTRLGLCVENLGVGLTRNLKPES